MATNPFFNKPAAEVEQAVADAIAPKPADAATPEAAEAAAPDEAEAAPAEDSLFDEADLDAIAEDLFGTDGDAEAAPDAEEDDSEDAEPSAEEPKGKSKKPEGDWVPLKRLNKELHKRTQLQEELREVRFAADAIQDTYKEYKDPVGQMRTDARFMGAVETLSQKDPRVQAAVNVILTFMETGEIPAMSDSQQPSAAPAPKSAQADPRIDAIVTREAHRVIDAALPANIRPSFKNVVRDYIVANASDLADLDNHEVVSLTSEFIKAKGFTKDEVYVTPSAKAAPAKPPTSSGRQKAVVVKAAKGAGDSKPQGREAPKSIEEWEAAREARIAAFASERNLG
jgi:hypothetical protein